ncbi:MAG TPA: Holliday junction resolvase RuvX [Acidimicrobiales bacterium]|nr:Holliday junction resolvase RuvX [Acidimicrobiales bacterium]
MRVAGIDLGERRIGVAVSDSSGLIASPRAIVRRSGDPAADRAEVARILADDEVQLIVVGLPVSLDGKERVPAESARAEASALSELMGIPVVTQDERHTSVVATRLLRATDDAARGTGGRKARARGSTGKREHVDAAAAAVILQSYLDSERAKGGT